MEIAICFPLLAITTSQIYWFIVNKIIELTNRSSIALTGFSSVPNIRLSTAITELFPDSNSFIMSASVYRKYIIRTDDTYKVKLDLYIILSATYSYSLVVTTWWLLCIVNILMSVCI